MALEGKTAKNSKWPKLLENSFEPVGKGGWPPISIWIKGEDEETNPKIHFLGDTSSSPHSTQSVYEESLLDNQINEMSKG